MSISRRAAVCLSDFIAEVQREIGVAPRTYRRCNSTCLSYQTGDPRSGTPPQLTVGSIEWHCRPLSAHVKIQDKAFEAKLRHLASALQDALRDIPLLAVAGGPSINIGVCRQTGRHPRLTFGLAGIQLSERSLTFPNMMKRLEQGLSRLENQSATGPNRTFRIGHEGYVVRAPSAEKALFLYWALTRPDAFGDPVKFSHNLPPVMELHCSDDVALRLVSLL